MVSTGEHQLGAWAGAAEHRKEIARKLVGTRGERQEGGEPAGVRLPTRACVCAGFGKNAGGSVGLKE